MFDSILLPTDGSEGMARVVERAGELARVHDASVHALYVVDTSSLSTLPTGASIDGLQHLLETEGETAVEQASGSLPGDVSFEGDVVRGSPADEIVDHAAADDCDVVVMGTHGRGGLNRLLLGSVAERVVRRSPIPVLTVRVGEERDRLDEA